MKIGFVSQPTDVAPPVGGASISIWIDEVASRVARSHEVTVYSRKTNHYADEGRHSGVQHVRVSTRLDERIIRFLRRFEGRLRRVLARNVEVFHRTYYFTRCYYLFYILGVARRARQDKMDVLVVTNYSQFVPLLRLFCRRAKLTLIMQCDWLIELAPRVVARRIGHADAILGCSTYIVDGIRKSFPRRAERCHTLYNASNRGALQRDAASTVSRDMFVQSPEDKIVVFVGRITPEKGIHVLIEAMHLVLESRAHCRLLIVGGFAMNPPNPRQWRRDPGDGDGFEDLKIDYEGHLRRLAAPLGEHVRFVGDVPHHELAGYYGLGDVFVHPSLWNEPFGMTLTEAMACGCPVVSTQTGGIPEIVLHGKTGYLVEPNDPAALAERIVELLGNDDLRHTMGQAGKERVEQEFSWDNTAQGLLKILQRRHGHGH